MRRAHVLFAEVLLGLFLLTAPVRADIDSGLMAYANGDFDTAARVFSVLAKSGDKEAQYYMGLLYEEGQGVPKRFDEAEKCYTKAAQQGYLDAYFALGELYLHQPGDKKDRVSARDGGKTWSSTRHGRVSAQQKGDDSGTDQPGQESVDESAMNLL
jgi:TPR repeat protein